ncbi:MAG: helix-turn-helix domain-containing protein [Pseudonocardiaceae bacterium]
MTRRRDGLAARRRIVGHTQESLAERLHVDRATVARWERGESRPQPSARRELAEVLAVSLDALDRLLDETAAATKAGNSAARAEPATGPPRGPATLAICGSRATDTEAQVIDAAVGALARFVMLSRCKVNHGPVGVGIEVMTYIADHYRPPDFTATIGLFGRQNIVHNADCVIVVGGATGTAEEVDLAIYSGTTIVPFPASGGTARRTYERAQQNSRLRRCLPQRHFDALSVCDDADQFVEIVRQALTERKGTTP